MGIETLNPKCSEDVAAVAALHRIYLSASPVARLGDRFMREFYYTRLVEDRLFRCLICRVDGQVVGFISYTEDALGFMSRGLKKHFFLLCSVMLRSLFERPTLVSSLILVLRAMMERGKAARESEAPRLGEAMSMAVLPGFENYVASGGTSRLAVRLFLTAAEELRRSGANRVQLMVQPSNLAANLFYSALGCSFEKIEHAGMVIHRYIYHLQPAEKEASS
jgi:ribosomal protein S18 acetylase RimI-like enzyme